MNFQINSTGEKLVADLAYMDAKYPGDYTQLPDDVVPIIADPCEWLMDIGPFTDRLGTKSILVDMSTDLGVIAVRNDLARRKWIDLKNPKVAGGLYYLAGQTVPTLGTLASPILTLQEVAAILAVPALPIENMAMRKLYFS
jgi:hypothetical protein